MKVTSEGPTSRLGAAAIPVSAKMAQGYQSHALVNGSPGTDPIPVNRAQGVPQGITHRTAGAGYHGSSDAPDVFFPGVYYYGPDSMQHPGMISYLSDNQMPLPAIDPKGLPSVAQVRPVFQGQVQVKQPWNAANFPNRFG